VFKAAQAASAARLGLIYMRPWEGAATAADRFAVQVQIEP
jgi:predicted secreted protein